ncbi:MAG: hypothetical protein R3263_13070, partial [Myxococcota bacterium]|nr:hypothetical protein [Myxococcota bacterium]
REGDVEEARRWADAAGDAAWTIVSRMRIALALDKGGAAERAAHVLRGILAERPDFEPARRELRRIEARAEEGGTDVS